MKKLSFKILPVLAPLLLLIVVLTVYTVLNFRSVSAAGSLSVGQQYLNSLNYGGAVAAFTRAIEIDPTNREAYVGLAKAYMGTGDYEFAQEVLEDLVYTDQPDEEATLVMVDLMQRTKRPVLAVSLVRTLIETTDKDEYYELMTQLFEQIYAAPRSLAVGTDQTLVIRGGQVLGRGSNTLGQLGVEPGSLANAEDFMSTRFSGQPVKVICVGRTSFVVDASGALWMAGENRWGQGGLGYAVTSPQGGWQQVPTAAPVVDVAGTTGRLLVLLTDGSLWTAGAGGSQTLEPVSRFPSALMLAANQQQVVVLTASGQLYRSSSQTPNQWELVAGNAYDVTLSDTGLCWVGSDNSLNWSGYGPSVPGEWYANGYGTAKPGFTLSRWASVNGRALLTDSEGRLYELPGDGTCSEITLNSPVAALYAQGGTLVVELEDGTVRVMQAGADGLQPLE